MQSNINSKNLATISIITVFRRFASSVQTPLLNTVKKNTTVDVGATHTDRGRVKSAGGSAKAEKMSHQRILCVAEKNDAAKNISALLSNNHLVRKEGRSKYNKLYCFDFNFQVCGLNFFSNFQISFRIPF